jgi:iron complex outermembrane receptor protein
MLRLAPNLQVAQITASTFAITARGFNGPAASKLLVLIDGRSLYTPLAAGQR